MKLIPKAKPVKIRISCLGIEHFSIDSLRESFSCREIISKLDKPLIKWLIQQNEIDIAQNVENLIDNKDSISPFLIVAAFFPEFKKEPFSKESLCAFWLKKNYKSNALRFLEEMNFSQNDINPKFKNIFIELYRNEDETKLKKIGLDKKQLWQENLRLAKQGDKIALDYLKQLIPKGYQYDNIDNLDLLFFNRMKIDQNDIVKNISITLNFWKNNGYINERDEFININREIFSKVPVLMPYVIQDKYLEIISILAEISSETDIQRMKNSSKTREEFYGIFNDNFKHLTSEELLQCVKRTVDCINNKLKVNNRISKATKDYDEMIKTISGIKKDVNDLKYINYSYHEIVNRQTTYINTRYYQVIYNVLNKVRGFSLKQFEDMTYSYAYCNQVIPGKHSSAIMALNLICQSLIFSEKEFNARHNILYIG